eukprot:3827257-Alexandrium_andersonii.AAC.1
MVGWYDASARHPAGTWPGAKGRCGASGWAAQVADGAAILDGRGGFLPCTGLHRVALTVVLPVCASRQVAARVQGGWLHGLLVGLRGLLAISYSWSGPSVAAWQHAYLHSGLAGGMGCGVGREVRE